MYPATVEELNIPKDKFDAAQKLMNSNETWYKKKDKLIAAQTGIKALCCVCGGITSSLYQVTYSDPEGAVRLEIYCSTHIEIYQETKDSTSEELAARYNCQIGEVPPTIRQPWD